MMLRRALMLALFALPALAQPVPGSENISLNPPLVADISQPNIQIHASFTGAQLLIFGARNLRGDIVIAVRGPSANVRLRRKERIAGMWMHVEQHKYEQLPLFYALASTRPLKRIASPYVLSQLGLGERHVITKANMRGLLVFDRALQQLLSANNHWQEPFGEISYFGESLFRATLDLPDSMRAGDYTVEIYLFDKGHPVAFQTIPLRAYKTGIDARIYNEAQNRPWMYGLCAIAMALAGGWLAHRLFHKH